MAISIAKNCAVDLVGDGVATTAQFTVTQATAYADSWGSSMPAALTGVVFLALIGPSHPTVAATLVNTTTVKFTFSAPLTLNGFYRLEFRLLQGV